MTFPPHPGGKISKSFPPIRNIFPPHSSDVDKFSPQDFRIPPFWGENEYFPPTLRGKWIGVFPPKSSDGGKISSKLWGENKNSWGENRFWSGNLSFTEIFPPLWGENVFPPKWGENTLSKQLDFGGKTPKFSPQTPYFPPIFSPHVFPPKFLKTPCFGGNEKVIFPPYGG